MWTWSTHMNPSIESIIYLFTFISIHLPCINQSSITNQIISLSSMCLAAYPPNPCFVWFEAKISNKLTNLNVTLSVSIFTASAGKDWEQVVTADFPRRLKPHPGLWAFHFHGTCWSTVWGTNLFWGAPKVDIMGRKKKKATKPWCWYPFVILM